MKLHETLDMLGTPQRSGVRAAATRLSPRDEAAALVRAHPRPRSLRLPRACKVDGLTLPFKTLLLPYSIARRQRSM
jgi:uncharacterized protein YceK